MQGRGTGCALAACARAFPGFPAGNARSKIHAVSGPGPVSRRNSKKRPRVQLYLPIADIPVNVFLILAMGAAVGFVSGMLRTVGGFPMNPLLLFLGLPPPVAVASLASPIPAASFSRPLPSLPRRATVRPLPL